VTSTLRKKRIIFKLLTTLISSCVCILVLVAAELYLHHKHGINLRGYRGPSLGTKQAGEKRVAILGGSTTWGFGVPAGQDVPAQLEKMLAQTNDAGTKVTTINLGWNNEGSYSFQFTLNDYDYLNYDAVIFYSGYNDLSEQRNYNVYRRRSPVFVWTGYFPLLPSLTLDKLTVWKSQLLGQNHHQIFQPPDVKRAPPPETFRQQAGPRNDATPASPFNSGTCPAEWSFYCDQLSEAINISIKKGKRVLIVTEPYISDRHVEQQRTIAGMISARFAENANVRYLDLGTAVDLRDPALCWDGMHLTQEGNRRIAAALVQPVRDLLQR
jgi:lysophospholipase L1-like esterase